MRICLLENAQESLRERENHRDSRHLLKSVILVDLLLVMYMLLFLFNPQKLVAKALGVPANRIVVRTKRMG